MKEKNRGHVLIAWIKNIKRNQALSALLIALACAYDLNPLTNIRLKTWDRTFSSAVLSGISINTRIGHLYKFFFFYIPLFFVLALLLMTIIWKQRPKYEDHFTKFNIFLFFVVIVSYISKYTAKTTVTVSSITGSPLLNCLLIYIVLLSLIALIDQKQRLNFKDVVYLFLFFMIALITCNQMLDAKSMMLSMIVMSVVIIVGAFLVLRFVHSSHVIQILRNEMALILWLPALLRVVLEVLYFFVEKGAKMSDYYTYIGMTTVIYPIISLIIAYFMKNKQHSLRTFGYAGAIVSITMLVYFSIQYQYVFSYDSMAKMYELGNSTSTLDTYLYGKLPIIDYFPAHALGNVLTRLLYCVIHSDVNGVLMNPYEGLTSVIAFLILFYIMCQIFNQEIAVLYVLLFPGILDTIKWTSVCFLSIALLLKIMKKPTMRSYLLFWIGVLFCAFYSYDEGISLGLACIVAYLIACVLTKTWKQMRNFILSGCGIGILVLGLYGIYASMTGIPVVSRIKEWMSLSVGSSSSWATADFGDPSSFAFLMSYFVVPITALMLMIFVIARYIKSHKHLKLTTLTVAFAIAELLFINRGIVYHNLAVDGRVTSVLLNFIHWTVACYVLYKVSLEDGHGAAFENKRFLAFAKAMMIVILIECTAVTQMWPTAQSSLLAQGITASESWNLHNGTKNIGQKRIVYDQKTKTFIQRFEKVFDTLLTPKQTFIDFANVTSLYMFTGRTRPCYSAQSPSLLTGLYSQECFLKEVAQYDCPLAVLGTTQTHYLQAMAAVPHHIRYYLIAEYIYRGYRPLVNFGEFSIWCKKNNYGKYKNQLTKANLDQTVYKLVDYGYDFTTTVRDDAGSMDDFYKPYHAFDLGEIPYLWANKDQKQAIHNRVLTTITAKSNNTYSFKGSQFVDQKKGNYLRIDLTNASKKSQSTTIVFYDSKHTGAKFKYSFKVRPGKHAYLIRVSQDYFWGVYNIDHINLSTNKNINVDTLSVLEGD